MQDAGVIRKLSERLPDIGRKMEYLLNTGAGLLDKASEQTLIGCGIQSGMVIAVLSTGHPMLVTAEVCSAACAEEIFQLPALKRLCI